VLPIDRRNDTPKLSVRNALAGWSMRGLRTIPGFVHLLVALFMVAQFSGVVSSPRSNAEQPPPELVGAYTDDQHAHDHGHVHDHGTTHRHDGANLTNVPASAADLPRVLGACPDVVGGGGSAGLRWSLLGRGVFVTPFGLFSLPRRPIAVLGQKG
jgi:hypothetical protein